MIMNPRPLVAASNSTATMLLQAPAMAKRMPVRMNGRAARICTCSMAYREEAPSVLAHNRRSSGTSSRAATVVTAISGTTPTMISTSLGISPMPSQTMKSGMKASGQRPEDLDDGIDQMPHHPAARHRGAERDPAGHADNEA